MRHTSPKARPARLAAAVAVGITAVAANAAPAKAQSRAEMDAMGEQIRVLQRRMEEMQRSADHRPELRIDSNRLVDTGTISANGAYTIGGELALRYPVPNLRFMFNYLYGEVDRLNAAGTQQIGQDFHAIAVRTQFAF